MHLNELAKLMRTAGDESRIKILCIIFGNKKMCVSDIAEELGMSVAIVSHHLQVMSQQGLVMPMREGKHVCYQLPRDPFVRDLKRFICKHRQKSVK
jgi:DNA-binding transcriptional ArsR family regulator